MATELDWLEIEIRRCHDSAVALHNEPLRERYSSWLGAIARIRVSQEKLRPRVIPREESLKEFSDTVKKHLEEDGLYID